MGHLIRRELFSIGLDKEKTGVYIRNMRLFSRSKDKAIKNKRKEFIEFTAAQFKQLANKRINIPIKLFHL